MIAAGRASGLGRSAAVCARPAGVAGVAVLAAAMLAGCAAPVAAPPALGASAQGTSGPWSTPTQQWVLDPGYYLQAVAGHLALLRAARPVSAWLDDPATREALRVALRRAQQVRRFAVEVLHLPDNASYTRYVALQRPAVVWNVVATPALDLQPHRWCFPLTGCVAYRGYYREEDAHAFARILPPEWDVAVLPVPAYSTLGWTQWLGGDPLLSTFLRYPAAEVARLLFHELAHQVVYVPGDSAFNESFATAVERLGVQRWLALQATPQERAAHARFEQRRQAWRDLLRRTRAELQALYARDAPVAHQQADKRRILDDFQRRYQALRATWDPPPADDAWVRQANNALFALDATYEAYVPAFMALFEREGGDFARFYRAVGEWARLPAGERRRRLEAMATLPAQSSVSTNSM